MVARSDKWLSPSVMIVNNSCDILLENLSTIESFVSWANMVATSPSIFTRLRMYLRRAVNSYYIAQRDYRLDLDSVLTWTEAALRACDVSNSLILKSTNKKVLSNSMAWHERKHNHRVARKLFVVLYNTVSCTIILPPNPPTMPIVSHLFDNGTQPSCSPNFPHVTIPKVEYYTILYSTIRYYLQLAGSRPDRSCRRKPRGVGGGVS